MHTLIKAILPLCLLLTFAGAAAAKTPDGHPPSEETVCDGESGAAYGLCNAYCEAMDCESADPHASATACNKVGSKFLSITGRAVPCELTCPCTSIPGFNATLAGANSCFDPSSAIYVSTQSVYNGTESAFADAPDISGSLSCGYIAPGTSIILPLTQEEASACNQLIRGAIASRGLTCSTPE
jgi:hypothetical protein